MRGTRVWFAGLLAVMVAAPALAQGTTSQLYAGMTRTVKLNIGTTGERRHVENTRGMPFGGAAVIVGTGRNQRAHVYTATSCADLAPGSIEKIDVKALAPTFGSNVKGVVPNAGRNWTFDEMGVEVGVQEAEKGELVDLAVGHDAAGVPVPPLAAERKLPPFGQQFPQPGHRPDHRLQARDLAEAGHDLQAA